MKVSSIKRALRCIQRALLCVNTKHCSTHCSTLQQLQHTATHCHTLPHTATHCHTLPHTATHCHILQHTGTHWHTLAHTGTHCNTLQHTATHCNTLQHTATHCNTLPHTVTHCNFCASKSALSCIKRALPAINKVNGTLNRAYTLQLLTFVHRKCLILYQQSPMGWLRLVWSIKLQVSWAKETCKRDYILQKRPIIFLILLTVATPYLLSTESMGQVLHQYTQ